MEDLVQNTQKVVMLTLPGNPGDNVMNSTINAVHSNTILAADLVVVSWHTFPDTYYVIKHRYSNRYIIGHFGYSREEMNNILAEYYTTVIDN